MTIVTCVTVLRTANEGLVLLRSANIRKKQSEQSALSVVALAESQLTPSSPKDIKYPVMSDTAQHHAVTGFVAPAYSTNKTSSDAFVGQVNQPMLPVPRDDSESEQSPSI